MKIVDEICKEKITYSVAREKEKIVFWDIETTGFSPKTSALYLIGVIYYQMGTWRVKQWFADDYLSEKEILICFFEFIKAYQVIIHFNGSTFDIPFIEKKCKQHHLTGEEYQFSDMESVDLFRIFSACKKRIKIENSKQKTIEEFLGIERTDLYSGGQLIKLYQEYSKLAYVKRDERTEELERILLLHNHDDLVGMLKLSSVVKLCDLLNGEGQICSLEMECFDDIVIFTGQLDFEWKESYQWRSAREFLNIEGKEIKLVLAPLYATLRYYYRDYKVYYYLPKEDVAIHKSVAGFVEKEYRQRAKKENCYTYQEGRFLPVFREDYARTFREEYDRKEYYILLDDEFLEKKELQREYLNHFLKECPKLYLEKVEK